MMVIMFGALVHTAHAATASPARLPTETGGVLTVMRGPGEKPFNKLANYSCLLGRKGQFSIVLPPKNYKQTGVHVSAPGVVVDGDKIMCQVPRVVTAGNTTVCVTTITPATKLQTHFQPLENGMLKAAKKDVCTDLSYAPAHFIHFPLFVPAFDRRPWIREAEGALLAHLDMTALQG